MLERNSERDAVGKVDTTEILNYRRVERRRAEFHEAYILLGTANWEETDILRAAEGLAQCVYRPPKLFSVRRSCQFFQVFLIHGPTLSVVFCAYRFPAAPRVRYTELSPALDSATGHQQNRTSRNGHASCADNCADIPTRISTGIHRRIAGCRRAPGLALLQILNRLLDVADALLHLPGNLF